MPPQPDPTPTRHDPKPARNPPYVPPATTHTPPDPHGKRACWALIVAAAAIILALTLLSAHYQIVPTDTDPDVITTSP